MGAGPAAPREPARFECEHCGRTFTTAIGRGVHKRSAHPVEADAAIDVDRRRERWNAEETRLLAREEAKAVKAGGVRFMNQHLLTRFEGRTLEAVKGKRKNPEYRRLVAQFVAELSDTPSSSSSEDSVSSEAEEINASVLDNNARTSGAVLADLVGEIGWDGLGFEAQRLRDCAERCINGEEYTEPLLEWFTAVFDARYDWPPHQPHSGVGVVPADDEGHSTRRARRRREYATVQHLYRRDQKACADRVLGNGFEAKSNLDPQAFRDFWTPLFSEPSYPSQAFPVRPVSGDTGEIWSPASIEEVRASKVGGSKAAGPDRLSASSWNTLPDVLKQVIFNMFLTSGRIPAELSRTRTVFIPKKEESADPADFRPISMSSVITRHFHRLLALRLQKVENLFSPGQRAFQAGVDGLADNLCVVQSVLKEARQNTKTVHMVALDVSKAFDTVSRKAIVDVCTAVGLPRPFARYVDSLYEEDSTVLEIGGRCFTVPVSRGVKQGDPLSPLLFNLVIDQVLSRLDSDVGFDVGLHRVTSLAFADDLLLFGTTVKGLQKNVALVQESLGAVGLSPNPGKCFAVSLVASGRDHKVKTILTPVFRLGERWISQRGPLDLWRYLGIEFKGSGVSGCSLTKLVEGLERLRKAPLKPQQRLHIMRVYFLPRFYHAWVLGRVSVISLRRIDQTIRKSVRNWLALPKDAPNDYVHATVVDGGLGVPQMSRFIPLLRLNRQERLARSEVGFIRASAETDAAVRQLQWCRERIPDIAVLPRKERLTALQRVWAHGLYQSVDGTPLRESRKCRYSTEWIASLTRAIPSKDWIHYHAVHINALPSRMRVTRGRREPRVEVMCRAGCHVPETPAHAIQSCFRTHGGRVMRHDALAKGLSVHLTQKGWNVDREVSFRTPVGNRRPDMIAVRRERTVVLDVQVISAFPSLDAQHHRKIAKYRDEAEISPLVRKRYNRGEDATIEYASLTISWRGVWSPASVRSLQDLGVTAMQLKRFTTMVLAGSHKNWVWFCASAVTRMGRGG